MNTPGNNQPEQEDLDRAKRLMKGFDPGLSAKSAEDPVLFYLDAYKKSASLSVSAEPSDNVWESISASVDSDSVKQTGNLKLLNQSVYWKAAAILLAASLLVLAYLTLQPSEPELLASSGSERHVTELFDGSIITLRPYSELYIIEESDERQTYRIDGEAYFDVAENEARLFTAVSGDAQVTVTGTEFTLSNWSNAVRVYLESGSVSFSSLDGSQSVDLEPGEFSEQIENRITDPAPVSVQIFTGWLRNELNLNSRTVSEVAAEIEQHFNIKLEIPKSIRNERLTGSLQLQNSEQVLSDFALSLNGRFNKVENDRFRFEPLQQE